MKKVVITGAKGQLVSDVIEELSFGPNCDYEIFAFTKEELDVTDVEKVKHTFDSIDPDFWIQGASYHVVEQINENPKLAADINVTSLHIISNLCNKHNTTLINFSTNYVFDGRRMPDEGFRSLEHYNETDSPNPVNLYGILKYAGEMIVRTTCEKFYNIRVSGLFSSQGSRAKNGKCFPSIILENLDKNGKVFCVNDQIVNLTYTPTAAKWIVKMIQKEREGVYGTYHLANRGDVTWFEAAKEIADIFSYTAELLAAGDSMREAIFQCYESLVHVLMGRGFLRRDFETVREFEMAIRAALPQLSENALSALDNVFEEARYSRHEMGESHKANAQEALTRVVNELGQFTDIPNR